MISNTSDSHGEGRVRLDERLDGRVLLLVAHDSNRQQLTNWLSPPYDIADPDHVDPDADPIDLCIVDEAGFDRYADLLDEVRAAAAPVFVPVLFVSTRRPSTITAHRPDGVAPVVWERVDEVIETPVSKAELRRRLTVLLRTRRQAVELEQYSERMGFLNDLLRHELLNAMGVIKPRAQLLERRLDDENADLAGTIVTWSDEVSELVSRVSTLVETFQYGVDPDRLEAVDVGALVASLESRFVETYPEVTFTFSTTPASVAVDDTFQEVVGNLVHNAVQHNDAAEPAVDVRVDVVDGDVRITVSDNGPGIPDDQKEAVFRRTAAGLGSDHVGSGFGLFFVDSKVVQCDGRVRVEDNSPRGTRVVLELPEAT